MLILSFLLEIFEDSKMMFCLTTRNTSSHKQQGRQQDTRDLIGHPFQQCIFFVRLGIIGKKSPLLIVSVVDTGQTKHCLGTLRLFSIVIRWVCFALFGYFRFWVDELMTSPLWRWLCSACRNTQSFEIRNEYNETTRSPIHHAEGFPLRHVSWLQSWLNPQQ